jgi:hypothetical protein
LNRVLLEPSSLLRVAETLAFRLSPTVAQHICALLQTSRGITLVGAQPETILLAQAIAETAKAGGVVRGMFSVPAGSGVETVIEHLQAGEWLVLEQPSAEAIALLEQLIRGRAADLAHLEAGAPWAPDVWRVVVTHEPRRGEPLPPFPLDLRRHFPLVQVPQVD